MSTVTFRSEVFSVNEPIGLACVIGGLGGTIPEFEKPAKLLNAKGYDAIVYEYDEVVYRSGQAELLPALINNIGNDFEELAQEYKSKLYTGASLGSFIAFNLERSAEGPQTGLFATAGLSVSHSVYDSIALRALGIRKAFARNGYTEEKLHDVWRDIDVSPTVPPPQDKTMCVVLGGADWVINYRKARRNLDAWKQAGVPLTILTRRNLGHTGTIKWYRDNIDIMLEAAQLS